MISTYKESQALADLLAAYLPDAFVTLDADQVTPHLLDGTPCVFIPPPKLTETSVPAYVLRFQIAVIGAPVADQAQAWQKADAILNTKEESSCLNPQNPAPPLSHNPSDLEPSNLDPWAVKWNSLAES